MSTILFVAAILPVAVILEVIYRKDTDKEPISLLIKSFAFGALLAVPAVILESVIGSFTPADPILGGLFDGYAVAGFSEELCKLALFWLLIWRNPNFDEYYDGIIYAVFISMGFACLENILYVFSGDQFYDSVVTASVRAVVSVPGHFLFAVAMGYYLSLAKFDPAHRSSHLWKALLVPVFLHGTFDAILMVSGNLSDNEDLEYLVGGMEMVVFIIFDIMMWRKGLKRIKEMQERSRRPDFNPMNPFEGFKWTV